jgi:hypothetical protein
MNTRGEVHGVVRLDNVVKRAVTHRVNDRVDGIDPTDDDDRNASIKLLNPSQQLNPAHARQTNIGDDQINGLLLQSLERALCGCVDDHLDLFVFMAWQFMLHGTQEHVDVRCVIVNKQNGKGLVLVS